MQRAPLAAILSSLVLLTACSGMTPPSTGLDGSGSGYAQELEDDEASTGDFDFDAEPDQLSVGGQGGDDEGSTGELGDEPCVRFDLPDLDALDQDGDGVDGTICSTVFVDPLHANGSGLLPGQPLASIAEAIELAATFDPPRDVLVVSGTYEETVDLRSGVSIYGGYDWGFVTRDVSAPSIVSGSGRWSMIGRELDAPLTVQGFTIQGRDADAVGETGFALALFDSLGAMVSFDRCTIIAGHGADGPDGVDGAAGADGERGGHGVDGGFGGESPCAERGGGGASGLECPYPLTGNPLVGQGARGASGSSDCDGDVCDDVPEDGEFGGEGALGLRAEGASIGQPRWKLTDDGNWEAPIGESGSPGLPGAGGGGGGAASFDIDGRECKDPAIIDGGVGGGG
ncbi:MAG: hypothetical protein IAG13_27630, partial [Deltaproteobacteria bacterium]|nr:hypothetical protein [Nannocystaceae bacterium]